MGFLAFIGLFIAVIGAGLTTRLIDQDTLDRKRQSYIIEGVPPENEAQTLQFLAETIAGALKASRWPILARPSIVHELWSS